MATKRQSARLSEKISIKTSVAPLSSSSHLAKYKNDIPVKESPVAEAVTTTTTAKVTTARKVKAAGARKVKKEPHETIEPPENWKSVYEAIREYRKTSLAPVDTMGCERLGDVKADDKVKPSYHRALRPSKLDHSLIHLADVQIPNACVADAIIPNPRPDHRSRDAEPSSSFTGWLNIRQYIIM